MDSSLVNMSPRFLLRNIISTEQPRSPVTRSWPAVAPRDVETEGRPVRRSLRHRKTPDKHLITVQKEPPTEVEDQGSTTRRSRRTGRSLPSTGHSPDIHLKELHKVSQVGVQPQGDIVRRVSSRKRLSAISQTPQQALKMHLKQKLHESASGSAVVLESRRRSGLRRPGPTTSLLEDDVVTPRRLLRNIMSTAAVMTPVTHARTEAEGSDRPTDVSVASSTASIDLDLSDVTLAGIASTARVLRRTRQRQSFNVGAFEKNMDSSQVAELPAEESGHDLLSLSTSLGSASLSLNTPSVLASSRRAGLRRKTQRQTKFSAEDFIAAVHQRQLAGGHELPAEESGHDLLSLSTSLGSASLSLNTPSVLASSRRAGLRRKTQRQTKFSAEDFIAAVHQRQLAGGHESKDRPHLTDSFTHEISDLPDITTDIIHQRTKLYDTLQPPGGAEQGAGDRSDQPPNEEHPSTEERTSNEELPSTEDPSPSEGPPSAEEEEGAETNVEEEEQGKTMAMETQSEEEVAMETQSEEEVAMETQSEEEVPGYQTASGQPGVEGSSSRPRSEGHLLGDHRSEGHLPREHRSEGHLLGDHRSEGHLLGDHRSEGHLPREHRSEGHLLGDHRSEGHLPREHRSEGHLLGDHRSEGHLPRDHHSEGHLPREHRSEGHLPREHRSEGHLLAEHRSEGHLLAEHRSEGHILAEHRSEGHLLAEHRSEGHLLAEHRSEGHILAEHRSEGHLPREHRSEGHLPRQHRSEGHILAEHRSAQRERGYKSIGVIDPSEMMEENDLARIGPTNVADHESSRSSASQAEVVVEEEEEGVEGEEKAGLGKEGVQGVEGEEVEQAVVELELGDKEVQGEEEEVQGEEGEEEGDEEVMGEEEVQGEEGEEEGDEEVMGEEEVQGEEGEQEEELGEEGVQAEELQEKEQAVVVEVELGEEGVQEEGEQGDDGVPAEEFQKEEKATEEVEQGDEEEEVEQGDEEEEEEEVLEEVVEEEVEEEEEEEEEEGEQEQEQSAELSMKTPAFVRMKKVFDPPLGESSMAPQQGPPDTRKAPAKRRKVVRPKQARASHLPKSYLMSTFKHFAKTRVATDVFPALDNIVDAYFQRMALDLETYAHHAKRNTIEVADVELLLRRQGYVTDKVPVEVLIEKYLPMEYRRLLIPIATSGNIVIPKKK
ncbi:unnamed protein product [Boreogadus saida]